MRAVHAASAARAIRRIHSGHPNCPLLAARPSLPSLASSAATPLSIRSISIFRRSTNNSRTRTRLWTVAGLVLGGLFAVYAYDSSAGVHRWLAIPLLHLFTKDDAEASHKLAIKVLASGLAPVDIKKDQEDVLGFELWGRHFSNPVGLAAGFDKDGQAIDGLFKLGFSYVEIGSVTPQAQPGNPEPRLFRLPSTQSVINRYGFNSEGHFAVLERLQERIHDYITTNALLLPSTTFPTPPISGNPDPDPVKAVLSHTSDAQVIDALNIPRSLWEGKLLAVNLGKNKVSAPESIDDFVAGVQTLGPYADVLVVNVSSPNTPGLRSLQRREILQDLLGEVVTARNALNLEKKPVVVLKIAPDLSRQEIRDIAAVAKETKVDGIIVSNTTISRPPSAGNDPSLKEAGGLSGPPLKPLSLRTLQTLYALTAGSIPLIGCGGISTGADAIEYAKAGASFVQFYTALGYQGVGLPRIIKDEIVFELAKGGKAWKDMVGSGVNLESIYELGREGNPLSFLNLEEEGHNDFQRLISEVESAIRGEPHIDAIGQSHLGRESLSAAAKSTVPSSAAPFSTTTESGLMPDGTPQIIIFERPPAYRPARAWTRKDVEKALEEGKDFAREVDDKLDTAADITREAFKLAGQRFEKVGKDIIDDSLAKDIVDVTKAATKQAAEGLKQVGKDIQDDQFARDVADISKSATKQAADGFRQIGRDIRQDDFAKELKDVTADAVRQATDGFKTVGQDIKDDQFVRDIRDVSEEAVRLAKQNFETIGRNIRDEGDFTAVTKKVVTDAVRRATDGFQKVGKDIRDQGNFSQAVTGIISDATEEAVARFHTVGRQIKDEGDFSSAVREVANDAIRQANEGFRKLGRNITDEGEFTDITKEVLESATERARKGFQSVGSKIKEDGEFTRTVRDTASDAANQTSDNFQSIGKDVRHDPLLKEAKEVIEDSIAQAAQGFRKVGQETAVDPMLSKTKEVGRAMKYEVKDVTEATMYRPTGEGSTPGGGLFSLFSTFGERSNVTSESKRQV